MTQRYRIEFEASCDSEAATRLKLIAEGLQQRQPQLCGKQLVRVAGRACGEIEVIK